jgi:hypothetical protein
MSFGFRRVCQQTFLYKISEELPVIRPEPDLNRVFKFPGTDSWLVYERVGSMVLGSFP